MIFRKKTRWVELVDSQGERHRLPPPPQSEPEGKGPGSDVYLTGATAAEIADYFHLTLADAGWKFVDATQGVGIVAVFRSGDRQLHVLWQSGLGISLDKPRRDRLKFVMAAGVEPSALERDLAAIENLRDAGGTDAVQQLISLLDDDRAPIRREAVSALGTLKDKQSLESLLDKLEDDDSGVRQRAASALGEIGSDRAVEALIAGLDSHDHLLEANCAAALGKIRDKRAVTALISALDKHYLETRAQAALALGDIGDTAAIDPLKACLKDPRNRPKVTAAALISLNELLEPAEFSLLVKRLTRGSGPSSDHDPLAESVAESGTEILFDILGLEH